MGLFSQNCFTRFDFTKEKRYTISPISRQVLDSLSQRVVITVYLQGDLTGGMKRLQHATNDMLSDLQAYSHRKIQFEFIEFNLRYAVRDIDTRDVNWFKLVIILILSFNIHET